ncbi:hypothetical protein V6N13_115067 [Hibiscus sabdariffa]
MSQTVGPSLPEKNSCIFYNLIVASNLQDKKLVKFSFNLLFPSLCLKIPNKFVKKFGDELSSIAMLTVPGGRLWLVELRKENKRVWLDSGWTVFLEYYSICIGYFLVFRYEGNSRFNVHIYNLKASEINYQPNSLSNSDEPCHDGIMDSQPASSSSYFLIDNDFDECLDHDRKKCKNCTSLDQKNNADDLRSTFQSTRDKGIQFSGVEVTGAADEVGTYFLSGTQMNTKKIKQEIEPDVDEYESLDKFNMKEEPPAMNTPGIVHRRRGDVTKEGKQIALRVLIN